MQITDEFTLELPPQEAYELLLDLERVTPCMPGATLGDVLDDGSRAVGVKVKLGPMRFTYDGTVRIAEQDAAARRAVLKGAADEARGQGSAAATIAMQVEEATGGSRVTATADIELTGRAAQMGHGIVQSVSKQLIGQMTTCLAARFAGSGAAAAPAAPVASDTAPEPPPLRAGALFWSVLRERIASLFRRGDRGAA